jgi:methyl-accepting chemotaxis protein
VEESSQRLKESSQHVEESSQRLEESSQHVEESSQHVKESSQHVEESSQRVKESSQHVKESSHRRFQFKSSRSEPRNAAERLLHRRQGDAALVSGQLASRFRLTHAVLGAKSDRYTPKSVRSKNREYREELLEAL